MRATRTFTDHKKRLRKNGEEWLITFADTETHIPNVYETVCLFIYLFIIHPSTINLFIHSFIYLFIYCIKCYLGCFGFLTSLINMDLFLLLLICL